MFSGQIKKEIFRNAVDNSGDFVGLVADWLAFECWWRFHPPVAGGSRDCAGNQSRNWPASCLINSAKINHQGTKGTKFI